MRRLSPLFLLLLFCAPQPTVKREEPKPRKIHEAKKNYDIAFDYYRMRQYPKVIEKCKLAIKDSTTFIDAYILMGKSYEKLRNYQKAETTYLKAIKAVPKNVKPYVALGVLYRKWRRYQDAENILRKGIAVDTTSADLWDAYGNLKEDMKDVKSAIIFYEKSHKLNPKNLGTVFRLGRAYLRDGKPDKAIVLLEKVKSDHPNDIEVLKLLGEAYMDAKKYDKAKEQFQQILTITPRHVSSHVYLAEIYTKKKQYSLAEQEYIKALEIEPDNTTTYFYFISMLIFDKKDTEKARTYLKKAKALGKDLEMFLCLEGDLYTQEGFQALKKGIEKDDYNILTSAINKFSKAIGLYEKVIKTGKEQRWINYAKKGKERAIKFKKQAEEARW